MTESFVPCAGRKSSNEWYSDMHQSLARAFNLQDLKSSLGFKGETTFGTAQVSKDSRDFYTATVRYFERGMGCETGYRFDPRGLVVESWVNVSPTLDFFCAQGRVQHHFPRRCRPDELIAAVVEARQRATGDSPAS